MMLYYAIFFLAIVAPVCSVLGFIVSLWILVKADRIEEDARKIELVEERILCESREDRERRKPGRDSKGRFAGKCCE